jgi:hypothetical protein
VWSYEVVPEGEEPYEEFDLEDWLFPNWEVVEETFVLAFMACEPAFSMVSLAEGFVFPFQPKRLEGLRAHGPLSTRNTGLLMHVKSTFLRKASACVMFLCHETHTASNLHARSTSIAAQT